MPQPFDQRELLARVDDDIEFLTETIHLLASDGPLLMKEIHRASDGADAEALARAAHTLKGMISNFCAPTAQACALEVEKFAKAENLSSAAVAVQALDASLKALIDALNEFVATRA